MVAPNPLLSVAARIQTAGAVSRRERSWRTFVGVLVCVIAGATVIARDMKLGLLLKDTTINGGDTGAHVMWPAYLRDHVFNHGRISGWTPDWYAGFPIGRYYMPIPGMLIVLLDLVLPYNVAFKLVTTIGPITLPAAAYVLAKGLRAPWPAPPLFAAFALPFLYFTGYSIWGGNLPSNAAGEFSFGIALSLSLFFLGTLATTLRTRERLWLPALLLGLTVMSHVIVAIFVTIAGVIVYLWHGPARNFRIALPMGLVATLLASVWIVPLWFSQMWTFDMGWGKVHSYRAFLIPLDPAKDPETELRHGLAWAVILAAIAIVFALIRLRKATLVLASLALALAVFFMAVPDGAKLWNARILPFYYLTLIMLAAMGLTELVLFVNEAVQRAALWPARTVRLASAWVAMGAVAVTAGFWIRHTGEHREYIPSWIRWNNEGYEGKPEYPEYRAVNETMQQLGATYGCGRALWDPNDALTNDDGTNAANGIDKYGTSLALELLPYFSDSCIGSMEGLYFESSGTTPFHFIAVSNLAARPSNPVRDLRFGNIDSGFDLGIAEMRMLGVRYYMAISAKAKEMADARPDALRFLAETPDINGTPPGSWRIYEVLGTSMVEPLQYVPVVVGAPDAHADDWARDLANDWFLDPEQIDRQIVSDGPADWPRAAPESLPAVPKTPLPEVTVSEVEVGDDWIRFRVSQPGVPVLVKISAFANWEADGAQGPWRSGPNMMVVIPDQEVVTLQFGQRWPDDLGRVLSVIGLMGLVGLARWRPGPLDTGMAEADDGLLLELLGEPGAGAGLGGLRHSEPWAPPVDPWRTDPRRAGPPGGADDEPPDGGGGGGPGPDGDGPGDDPEPGGRPVRPAVEPVGADDGADGEPLPAGPRVTLLAPPDLE